MQKNAVGETQAMDAKPKAQASQVTNDAQTANDSTENMTKSRIEGVIIDGRR